MRRDPPLEDSLVSTTERLSSLLLSEGGESAAGGPALSAESVGLLLESSRWEAAAVALSILIHLHDPKYEDLTAISQTVTRAILGNVDHKEPRVRTLTASLVEKAMCRSSSAGKEALFAEIFPSVWKGVLDNYKNERSAAFIPSLKSDLKNPERPPSGGQQQNISEVAFDDTSGWRNLETSLCCYNSAVKVSEMRLRLSSLLSGCFVAAANAHSRAASN